MSCGIQQTQTKCASEWSVILSDPARQRECQCLECQVLCRFTRRIRISILCRGLRTLGGIHPLDLCPVADNGFDHQCIIWRTAFDVSLGFVFLHA